MKAYFYINLKKKHVILMCSESPCESCFVTYLLGPAGTECRLKGRFSLPLGLKVKRWVKVGPEKTAFLNLLKPSYSYVSFYSTYWGYQLKDYISFARQLHEERPLYNRFRRLTGLFSSHRDTRAASIDKHYRI